MGIDIYDDKGNYLGKYGDYTGVSWFVSSEDFEKIKRRKDMEEIFDKYAPTNIKKKYNETTEPVW